MEAAADVRQVPLVVGLRAVVVHEDLHVVGRGGVGRTRLRVHAARPEIRRRRTLRDQRAEVRLVAAAAVGPDAKGDRLGVRVAGAFEVPIAVEVEGGEIGLEGDLHAVDRERARHLDLVGIGHGGADVGAAGEGLVRKAVEAVDDRRGVAHDALVGVALRGRVLARVGVGVLRQLRDIEGHAGGQEGGDGRCVAIARAAGSAGARAAASQQRDSDRQRRDERKSCTHGLSFRASGRRVPAERGRG